MFMWNTIVSSVEFKSHCMNIPVNNVRPAFRALMAKLSAAHNIAKQRYVFSCLDPVIVRIPPIMPMVNMVNIVNMVNVEYLCHFGLPKNIKWTCDMLTLFSKRQKANSPSHSLNALSVVDLDKASLVLFWCFLFR